MRYALWNNKGGVGKSFLTFVFATEYARKNPGRQVIVVDMCPQANVSEILLGGNGVGAENLRNLIEKRKTIGGYFDERIRSPHDVTGKETNFSVNVHGYNERIPENISLVVGDPSLELQVQTINNIAVQELPRNSWKSVHSWVIDLEKAISPEFPGGTLVLIDCNPSFSSYTEQAVLAADRLIIPCSPDGSSARAIRNVSKLLYGYRVPEAYQGALFFDKVRENNMSSPKIHLVLLNRTTIYDNKPSRAFDAMKNQMETEIKELWNEDKEHRLFSTPLENLFQSIPDAHTVAIVAAHIGEPLSTLRVGPYEVNDTSTQINAGPLERYRDAIEGIIEMLEFSNA